MIKEINGELFIFHLSSNQSFLTALYIVFVFRDLKLKKGDTGPIELYLYLNESQPLDFSVAAQDLTAINSTLNDITLNFAKGTEAGKWFKFSWVGVPGFVYLQLKSKFAIFYVQIV